MWNNFFIKVTLILTIVIIVGCSGIPGKTITPSPQLTQQYIRLLRAAEPLCGKEKCNYKLMVIDDKQINAFTDGHNIVVFTGMLNIARQPEELALILSHEMAHNIMKHIPAKTFNTLLGNLLDIAASTQGVDTQGLFADIGSSIYSQSFEREADYLGLYIMARADYNITHVAEIWRKIGQKSKAQIKTNYFATHPGTAERFVFINKIVEEIQAKKRLGKDLLPEGFKF